MFEIAAYELVWLRDSDGFGYTFEVLEMTGINSALIACYSDCGSSRAGHRMRLVPQRGYYIQYFFHLAVGGLRLHYYQHTESPLAQAMLSIGFIAIELFISKPRLSLHTLRRFYS